MSELSINTTQNVNINFKAATVVDRILASLIDLLIKLAYGIVVFYIFFYKTGLGEKMSQMDYWSWLATIIIFFFPILIYSITLESIFEGQTLGKKILKIKVVKIDGYQAGFGDYLIRWIFRLIEKNFIFVIVGIVVISMSRKTQRIGDMAAGTAVITLKSDVTINSTILEELEADYVPKYPLVIKLTDNDVRIIKSRFENAKAKKDDVLMAKLREKVESVIDIKSESKSDAIFIKSIIKDYNYYTRNM